MSEQFEPIDVTVPMRDGRQLRILSDELSADGGPKMWVTVTDCGSSWITLAKGLRNDQLPAHWWFDREWYRATSTEDISLEFYRRAVEWQRMCQDGILGQTVADFEVGETVFKVNGWGSGRYYKISAIGDDGAPIQLSIADDDVRRTYPRYLTKVAPAPKPAGAHDSMPPEIGDVPQESAPPEPPPPVEPQPRRTTVVTLLLPDGTEITSRPPSPIVLEGSREAGWREVCTEYPYPIRVTGILFGLDPCGLVHSEGKAPVNHPEGRAFVSEMEGMLRPPSGESYAMKLYITRITIYEWQDSDHTKHVREIQSRPSASLWQGPDDDRGWAP